MFGEGRVNQHNFTRAAPNELKLSKGEYDDERWPMVVCGGGGGRLSGSVRRKKKS